MSRNPIYIPIWQLVQEIAQAALRRAAVIKARRSRARERLLTAALITVCLSLALCGAVPPGRYDGTGPPAQAAVSMLDGARVGGHVIAGVIGFTLGAAVAASASAAGATTVLSIVMRKKDCSHR